MRSFSRFNRRIAARGPTVLFTFFAIMAACSLPALARKPNWQPEILVQSGHSNWVTSSQFSPDGSRLLTGARDNRAILWDVATGRKLRALLHTDQVNNVAFSPDGSRALTSTGDGLAIYWDVTTGETLRTFSHRDHYDEDGREDINSVAIGPRGRRCAVGFDHYMAIVYDLETGESLLTLKASGPSVLSVEFSHDGSEILTSDTGDTAQIWDSDTGELLRSFSLGKDSWQKAIFSPEGRHFLTFGCHIDDHVVAAMYLWDAQSGALVHRFDGHIRKVVSADFSPDGRLIASVDDDNSVIVWRVNDFQILRKSALEDYLPDVVAFSPDSQTLVFGGYNLTLRDAQSGRVTHDFSTAENSLAWLVPSDDGRKLFIGSSGFARFGWDLATGRIVLSMDDSSNYNLNDRIVSGHGLDIWPDDDDDALILWDDRQHHQLHRLEGSLAEYGKKLLSPDGRWAAAEASNRSILVWDTETGRQRWTLKAHKEEVTSLTFSPDGKYLASGGEGLCRVWNVEGGQLERTLEAKSFSWCPAVFGPDGVLLATCAYEETITLWDWKNGRRFQMLRGHIDNVATLAFSRDGRRLLSGGDDKKVMLWDTRTGELLRVMEGHTSEVSQVAFHPGDDRMAMSGSYGGGTVRLWDLTTGRQLLQLVTVGDRDWLAATPEGLFDGSKGGREKVNFRVGGGLKVVPVDRFFQDFYQPGLLLTIWNGGRPLPEIELGGDAPPTLRLLSPRRGASDSRDVTIEVEAVDAGNGVSRWALYQNGARVLAPGESRPKGKATVRTFRVSLVEGENRFRITATNADGSWEAEPVRLTLSYQRPLSKPQLYVVAVGINRYAQETMNLKFAVSDAKAVAALFRKRGAALYAKVNVTELTDDQATRAGIQKALQAVAAKAQPQDTLLVFFAGHGTMVQQRYYFVPHEFTAKAGTLEADIRKQALPVDELGDWLAAVPSLKRMLIFDTCQSGGVLGLSKGARNPFALRGAIERLSRAQGVFTIAAAASTADAQEIPQLKHGALTYALLAGLGAIDEGPLADTKIRTNDPDEVVDVLQWFSFASGQVPRLTAELLGSAQDVQTSGEGTSFPVLPIVQ